LLHHLRVANTCSNRLILRLYLPALKLCYYAHIAHVLLLIAH
jgi:hypothetical protein